MNLYIPHNRRTPLQTEEALGPISIPRGSRGVYYIFIIRISVELVMTVNIKVRILTPLLQDYVESRVYRTPP